MSDKAKQKYLDLERKDKERFDRESAKADEERLRQQEERRRAQVVQEGEDSRCRGARQKIQEERDNKQAEREQRRLQREAEMDEDELAERRRVKEEKRRETEERQRKRAEEERALNKQHRKLDKEQAKKAANRLEYLFKQSSIFAKLKTGSGSMDEAKDEEAKEDDDADKKAPKTRGRRPKNSVAKKTGVHHIHGKDSEEEEDVEGEDEDQHVFLTKQPNCIKFGKLKAYQLESLNWMIHLAEKGLNGILADEVSTWSSIFARFALPFALVCSLVVFFPIQIGRLRWGLVRPFNQFPFWLTIMSTSRYRDLI